MTKDAFAPKDATVLQAEISAELGVEYEGNEELVDKMVARELKGEEFKASLHADKQKHLEGKEAYKQRLAKAGFDPETGEKIGGADPEPKGLSILDAKAIQDIPEEDIQEVIDYSKFKGVSLSEAKKHPVMQTLLKTRSDERKSAAAANAAPQRQSNKTNSIEAIVKRAEEADEKLSDEDMKLAAKAMVDNIRPTKA